MILFVDSIDKFYNLESKIYDHETKITQLVFCSLRIIVFSRNFRDERSSPVWADQDKTPK